MNDLSMMILSHPFRLNQELCPEDFSLTINGQKRERREKKRGERGERER